MESTGNLQQGQQKDDIQKVNNKKKLARERGLLRLVWEFWHQRGTGGWKIGGNSSWKSSISLRVILRKLTLLKQKIYKMAHKIHTHMNVAVILFFRFFTKYFHSMNILTPLSFFVLYCICAILKTYRKKNTPHKRQKRFIPCRSRASKNKLFSGYSFWFCLSHILLLIYPIVNVTLFLFSRE